MKLKINVIKRNIVVLVGFALLCTSCNLEKKQFYISFTANLDGNQDIYSISSEDIKSLQRITYTPLDYEEDIEISRDGKKIMYSVHKDYDTFVLDLETNNVILLNNPSLGLRSIQSLAWSINGDHPVISEMQTRRTYLYDTKSMSVEEMNIPQTFEHSMIVEPDFSPDGRKIAYIEFHNSPPSIKPPFVYNFDTGMKIPITGNETAICTEPKWSPNGKQILLYCNLSTNSLIVDSHTYLFAVEDDASSILQIVDLPCGAKYSWSPEAKYAWAPGGKRFVTAYCQLDEAPLSLSIYNPDGSLERDFPALEPSQNKMFVTEMVWSPNGKKIIYIAGESEDELDIYMINPDGSGRELLTSQSANYKELTVFRIEQ